MKKVLILPITVVFISILTFLPHDAHAITTIYLEDKLSCEAAPLAGTWAGSTCTINNLTLNSGDSLNIGVGIILKITGTLTNSGNTYNHSFITVSGTIKNFGVINNDGLIMNTGSIVNNNGGIINDEGSIYDSSGTFTNNGIIDSYRAPIYNDAQSTFTNSGIINNLGGYLGNSNTFTNSGTINNNGTIVNNHSFTITNSGSINNYNKISNNNSFTNGGTIIDFCGGTIDGINPLQGAAPVSVPCSPSTFLVMTTNATTAIVGQTLNFTYFEINNGSAALKNPSVSDNSCFPVTSHDFNGFNEGDSNMNGVLDGGEIWVFQCMEQQKTVGKITHTATGDAVDQNANHITAPKHPSEQTSLTVTGLGSSCTTVNKGITLTPNSGSVGDSISANGNVGVLVAGRAVSVYIYPVGQISTNNVVGSATTDYEGCFMTAFTVPPLTPGNYVVQAEDFADGAIVDTPFTVIAPVPEFPFAPTIVLMIVFVALVSVTRLGFFKR